MKFEARIGWYEIIEKPNSVLPYHSSAAGHQDSGSGTLSSDDQVLTVTSRGRCGHTYFVNTPTMVIDLTDDDSVTGEHLLQVIFS